MTATSASKIRMNAEIQRDEECMNFDRLIGGWVLTPPHNKDYYQAKSRSKMPKHDAKAKCPSNAPPATSADGTTQRKFGELKFAHGQ